MKVKSRLTFLTPFLGLGFMGGLAAAASGPADASPQAPCSIPATQTREQQQIAQFEQWMQMYHDNPNAKRRGKLLVEQAVAERKPVLLRKLLEKGADVNTKTQHGSTILESAASNADADIVCVLEEFGADLAPLKLSPLHKAVLHGDLNAARELARDPQALAAKDWFELTPLHWAAGKGDTAMISLLLEMGAEIDAQAKISITPLHYAATNGKEAAVRLLVERGADINHASCGNTILDDALGRGNPGIVRFLLQHGADVHLKGDYGAFNSLHVAAIRGDAEGIGLLIASGADPDVRNRRGDTALHFAAEFGYKDAVFALIKNGADIRAKNDYGFTILHEACNSCRLEGRCEIWLDPDTDEYRAGIARDKLEIAQALLDAGVNPKSRDEAGRTPLHIAVLAGRAGICRLLLEHGADAEAEDNEGVTPLMLVRKHPKPDLMEAFGIPYEEPEEE